MKFKLRPQKELKKAKYYLHIVLDATIILGLLEIFVSKGMFTFNNILISSIFLLIADITSHTILKLD